MRLQLWPPTPSPIPAYPDYRGGSDHARAGFHVRAFLGQVRALLLEVVMLLDLVAILGGVALAAAVVSLRVVKQYERGLVFRFLIKHAAPDWP